MHPISFLLAAVLAFAVPTHVILNAVAKAEKTLASRSAGPRWV